METPNQPTKKNWGGARAGSGRKKTCAKVYGFNAPEDVMQILEAVEKKTEFINQAVRHYAAYLQRKKQ